ncbi:MAG: hypothetical protein CVV27_16900 [Candidatus Melainabacteria bacterium HGW-Melainabacteria-1]|nr:MAG: hypothetical protein CVV27_16900 [Candidatus Melainabacteria bacterium HGW-Melainabacteria-1]
MANLNNVLDEIDSLTASERLKVMERILMHLRAEHETSRTEKSLRLTGRAGLRTGVTVGATPGAPPQDVSANPYDMKGLGA